MSRNAARTRSVVDSRRAEGQRKRARLLASRVAGPRAWKATLVGTGNTAGDGCDGALGEDVGLMLAGSGESGDGTLVERTQPGKRAIVAKRLVNLRTKVIHFFLYKRLRNLQGRGTEDPQ